MTKCTPHRADIVCILCKKYGPASRPVRSKARCCKNRAAVHVTKCRLAVPVQAGDIVLHEEERLTSESKFYIVESGRIDCYKTFEARARTHNVMAYANASTGERRFGGARESKTLFACAEACHFTVSSTYACVPYLHVTPESLLSMTFHWMMASRQVQTLSSSSLRHWDITLTVEECPSAGQPEARCDQACRQLLRRGRTGYLWPHVRRRMHSDPAHPGAQTLATHLLHV